jgi:hypothetical protein
MTSPHAACSTLKREQINVSERSDLNEIANEYKNKRL